MEILWNNAGDFLVAALLAIAVAATLALVALLGRIQER
jgi:hypothetical protein